MVDSVTITFDEPNHQRQFRSFETFLAWLDKEEQAWAWLGNHPTGNAHQNVAVNFAAVRQGVHNIQASGQSLSSIADYVSSHYQPPGWLRHTEGSFGKQIDEIRTRKGDSGAAFAYGFLKQSVSLAQASEPSHLAACILLAMPEFDRPESIATRLQAERNNYRQATAQSIEKIDAAASERAANYASQLHMARRLAIRQLLRSRRLDKAFRNHLADVAMTTTSSIRAVEDTFRRQMGLQAPVEYWNNKADTHRANANAAVRRLQWFFPLAAAFFLVAFGGAAKLLLISILFGLAGCAGYHSMPPQNYSSTSDGLERIVFDQWGDPYPRSERVDNLPIPPQVKRGTKGFSVRQYYHDRQMPFNGDGLIQASAKRIEASIRNRNAGRVVFLIKGFNNSFQANETEYANVRHWLEANGRLENVVFVQVYWDAINRGPGTAPVPLAYFGESMTYSNLAGACGLRALLGHLPAATNVTFLTHSRGAAAALSAIANPLFDKKIDTGCLRQTDSPKRPLQLSDVRVIAYAPAIGDGHLRARDGSARVDYYDVIDRIYSSLDPNDPAVTKSGLGVSLPDKLGGDTRFGGTESYVGLIDKLFAEQSHSDDFAQVAFTQPTQDWMRHLDETNNARCLMWAGGIFRDRPETCTLVR